VRSLLALALLLPAAGVARAEDRPPTVRVWAATHLALSAQETTDEAGARWLEVRGRLTTERDEGIAGVEVRFERDGATETANSGADGSFRARLRSGPATSPWTARFDGGERLRPCTAVVPAPPAPPAGGSAWIVFVPLFALGAALLAALAVLLLRRAAGWLTRLRAAFRRLGAAGTGARRSGTIAGTGRVGPARVRAIDALRLHPLPGAHLESADAERRVLARADGDGWIVLPPDAPRGLMRLAGYVPREAGGGGRLAAVDEHSAEGTVRLLRGRDAVAVLVEALRAPGATSPAAAAETVLQIASRSLPPATALRLAALCYGPPRSPTDSDRMLLEELRRRSAERSGPAEPGAPAAEPGEIVAALAAEPRAPAASPFHPQRS
jgi:hypothetical protein